MSDGNSIQRGRVQYEAWATRSAWEQISVTVVLKLTGDGDSWNLTEHLTVNYARLYREYRHMCLKKPGMTLLDSAGGA